MTEDQWVQVFVARMRELHGPEEDTNIIYLLASSAYLVMRDIAPAKAAEQQCDVIPVAAAGLDSTEVSS